MLFFVGERVCGKLVGMSGYTDARSSTAGYARGWRVRVYVPESLEQHWCAYCGVTQADTLDHIVPVAALVNGVVGLEDNLVPACQSCNSTLGAMLFNGFADKQAWLYTHHRGRGLPCERPENIEVIFPLR